MSFAERLQGWLAALAPPSAIRAEPAEPFAAPPLERDLGGCAGSASSARLSLIEQWPGVPSDVLAWGEAAAEHYLDRVAVADDLGTDPVEADRVARREAIRVAGGVPWEHWPRTREATRSDDLLAKAVSLFGPKGPEDARPHDPHARFGA